MLDDSLPWLEPLEALVRDAAEREVPVLGVCFGHQIVARALLGPDAVRRSPTPEIGWFDIERTRDHPLFEGVEPRFRTFLSHFDEVTPGVAGIEVLARSERCPIQAYRIPGRPIWCVQFHAEMDAAETERLVRERSAGSPELGLDPDEVLRGAVDSSALRERLLANFLTLAAAGASESDPGASESLGHAG